MNEHQKRLLNRNIEVCKCKHGTIFHNNGFGKCGYPLIDHIPEGNCMCHKFELDWYIDHEGKHNISGEIIR